MKHLNLLSLFLLLTTLHASAQLDSCNVFLKGAYVEVGINWNGAYGSSCAAPTGYHARGSASIINSSSCGSLCSTPYTGLGFVADPDHDGWGTGTPNYYGDYFTPGYPQEGWSIMADGVQANAWNGPGCQVDSMGTSFHPVILDTTITGAGNTAYYDTAGRRYGVWQGVFDSIQITQITKLDSTQDYFTIHVFLKNLGTVARHNIYYLRTVDPDNDESLSGDFTTKNKIEFQLPNASNKVLVSAQGLHYPGGPLYLGTHDTTAKCFINRAQLTPQFQNLDSMYNGDGGHGDTTDYLYHDSLTVDVGISLVFKIADLAPSDSTHIVMAYVFAKNAVDSALNDTTLRPTNGHTQSVANAGNNRKSISAYPNPFTDELTVSGLTGTDEVNIYDMMGRKINGACAIVTNGSSSSIKVDNNMPGGVYILQVVDKNGNTIARIPLQKH